MITALGVDLPTDQGQIVHWYFPGRDLCEKYVMGDSVIDATMGAPTDVTCTDCIEWIHA